MRKIFWDNPYQSHLRTKVASVNGDEILFAETIGFSFSGGQESDRTTINGISVLSSRIENLLIYYTLSNGHGLFKGDDVIMEIDWPRRYRLMRLHFAAELVLEIVTRKFHFEKIGAHISETKARIDFVAQDNISSLFEAILAEYNDIIKADNIIQTGFTDVTTQKRFWKIEGFAEVPCGGTHVKSTAEVGYITLKRNNIGSSKERIELRLTEDSLAL